MNLGIYLNYQEIIDTCTKLNCKDSELSKVVKATLLDHRTSRYFRDIGQSKEVENKEAIIDEYLSNTDLGVINIRRANLTSKPVFTPN